MDLLDNSVFHPLFLGRVLVSQNKVNAVLLQCITIGNLTCASSHHFILPLLRHVNCHMKVKSIFVVDFKIIMKVFYHTKWENSCYRMFFLLQIYQTLKNKACHPLTKATFGCNGSHGPKFVILKCYIVTYNFFSNN